MNPKAIGILPPTGFLSDYPSFLFGTQDHLVFVMHLRASRSKRNITYLEVVIEIINSFSYDYKSNKLLDSKGDEIKSVERKILQEPRTLVTSWSGYKGIPDKKDRKLIILDSHRIYCEKKYRAGMIAKELH